MKSTFKILFVLAILSFVSCDKKRYPDTVIENEAVFYFDGTIDGAKKKITAGVNNYYMYTSHFKNGNLLQFNADLKRTDCGTCSGISLLLNDNHFSPPGSGLSDSSLKAESYSYARENSSDYNVNFTGLFNRQAQSYAWDFGDGITSSEPAPLHIYHGPGKYKICLTIQSSTGCYSQICNEIEIGENPFRTQVVTQQISQNTILFSQSTMGKAPFSFYWSFGDGATSTSPSATHTYKVNGSYPVVLMVTDAEGKTITYQYNTLTGNDASSCAANFQLGSVTPLPSTGFKETDIKWRDDNGKEYHSAKVDQPSDSYFTVEKVEEFERNENNEPTKKMKVSFSCVLSDGTKIIKIQDASAVISVSYP